MTKTIALKPNPEIADSVESDLSSIITELKKQYNIDDEAALGYIWVCVDSWMKMRGLKCRMIM